jgi:ABC-type nitrate/sulfonate/bicarbonate transport system permease component
LADYVVPSILFALFAVFSSAGAFLITAQYRSRTAGIVAALLTLCFFALLFLALLALMPRGTLPSS